MRDKKRDAAYAAGCTVIYMIVLWMTVPFVYGIIDDRSMMEIVSGQYLGTPDAHTIFSGYWYSLFLTFLYRLLPGADWYAIVYLLLQGICMCLILYRFIHRQTALMRKWMAVLGILIFLVSGAQALTQLTFTTTAAVLGVTVIFWYMTAGRIEKKDVLILIFLCFLTQQIRADIFYMILPVCAVLWMFGTFQNRGDVLWHRLIPAGVAGVLILGYMGNVTGYGSAEWRAYRQYDQNRTKVYDFPAYTLPVYEGAEEFYAGIGIEKKSRARTLMNYNYTADDRITPQFFQEYVEAHDQVFPPKETVIGQMEKSVKEYLQGVLSGKFHRQHVLALILYGLLAVRGLCRKEKGDFFRILCIVGVQTLLWCCLLYAGRIPERVIYSMNLMQTATALLLTGEVLQKLRISERTCMAGTALMCLLLCIPAASQLKQLRQQNQEMYHRNEDVEALKEYCMEHPENFYFNDVTSMAFTTYNVHLWREDPYDMNYMSLGDWMSFSPVWQEKLRQNGIDSVKEALYESENGYLICSFDKGLEYLISLYDNVICTETDKIPGFQIYRLQSL